MKRLYIKLAIIGLASFLFSCNDDLDEPQLHQVLPGSVNYSDPAAARSALVGAYSKFQSMGWEQIPLIAVRGDDVNSGGLGDQPAFMDTDNFVYDKNYWMYNSVFENWYQDILQITVQMEQLEKFREGGVDSQLIDQYQAECKTIRAYILLELSKVWEGAYLVESSDPTSWIVQDKTATMQWISDDLDSAIPYLLDMHPNQRTDLPGGMTKYTALAIKAMANQELGNYDKVAEATGQIINSGQFSLFPDFYELFKIPGKLCDENIWEIQYSDFGDPAANAVNHLWAFYGPQNWEPAVAGANAGWGFFEPSMKWIKFMLDRGEQTRLQTSVLFTDRGINEIKSDPNYATLPDWISNTTPSNDVIEDYSRALFASGKHYLPSVELTAGSTSYGSNKNYTVIRYAEILLMYAEAVTRGATASAGSADAAVNLVRQRAGMPNLSGVTTQNVLDEKFAELAMEWGVRYYDMVRTNNTSALSYDGRTFTMDKQYLPYPQEQLDKSPLLQEYANTH